MGTKYFSLCLLGITEHTTVTDLGSYQQLALHCNANAPKYVSCLPIMSGMFNSVYHCVYHFKRFA